MSLRKVSFKPSVEREEKQKEVREEERRENEGEKSKSSESNGVNRKGYERVKPNLGEEKEEKEKKEKKTIFEPKRKSIRTEENDKSS